MLSLALLCLLALCLAVGVLRLWALPLAFALFFLYLFMPNTRVRFGSALLGALLAGTAWQLAQWGYIHFQLGVARYNAIYGTMAVLPIFMIWLYASWVIVLFGVELGYVIQNLGTLQAELREKSLENPLSVAVHEEWGLRIVEALARRFVRGHGPQTAEQLAKAVELPVASVEDHLGILVRAEILATTSSDLMPGYIFTRPLEKLTVADVASTFRRQLSLPPRIDLREERTLLQLIG